MITKEQCKRIYDYNLERNLTTYNKEKELGFKIEEIDEWFKAETITDKIDALADIIVFSIGCQFKKNVAIKEYENKFGYSDIFMIVTNIFDDEKTITNCLTLIELCGYDSTLVMDEVIKHIESRKGKLNKETGKFQKFVDEYNKLLWYEPDYSKCLK